MFRQQSWRIGGLIVPGYGVPYYVNSIIGIISVAILLAFVHETVKTKKT